MALAKVQKLATFLQSKTTPPMFFDKLMIQHARIESAEKGPESTKLVVKLPVLQEFSNTFGPMHGGAIATAIDQFTTWAIFAADRDGRRTVSVDLSVTYISAALVGEELTIIAECNKVGKTLAFTSAEIWIRQRLVAMGKHTKYLFEDKIGVEE
ncbi:unnamed protein product [Blepharisma stoltei]|uniref:Acyl-coenzyme A thioesterase 13 n=1 Tax=Blepharisma stoltei TaxID=1481888 RepID=A0AAU9JXX7_9CILI|nr:unnamed protein product [Blepharisma stoltei]